MRRTRDKATPTATQPFLLKSPHDHALFKLLHDRAARLGGAGPRAESDRRAGDGYLDLVEPGRQRYVLRETLRELFSELVGYNQFARGRK